MTPLFYLLSLTLLSLSLPVQILLSPKAAFELGFTAQEPPLCRPETAFETASRYPEGSGKAWRFSRRGAMICPREIFGRQDRNSFYNFVFSKSSVLLESMGRQAIKIIDQDPRGRGLLWTVQIREDVPVEIRQTLLAILQSNLTQALGSGKVIRQRVGIKPHVVLSVGARAVIEPDFLFYGQVSLIDEAKVRSLENLAKISVYFIVFFALLTAVNGRANDEEVIFSDIRLMGADLIDEMVYQWQEAPPLGGLGDQTALVLVGVQAPLGLDVRFKELVENRLFELLRQNPKIPVNLAYCGPCRQWVAKSNPTGTILSWAMDQPEVLQDLLTSTPQRHGLALHFEAEGQELVLRAQVFNLGASQKILWARTIATSSTARRALRDETPLISLSAAKKQQAAILNRRDPLEVTSRIAVRVFRSGQQATLTALPLPFFEQSFEVVPLPQRNLRSAVTFGFTSIQESLSAWSVGGHLAGLILRDQPSLIHPDLYWLVGAHYVRLRGPGAAVFGAKQLDINSIRNIQREPKATFVSWRLGVEAHIKHRLGFMLFLEDIPLLKENEAFDQDYLLGIPYLAYGFGVLIKW